MAYASYTPKGEFALVLRKRAGKYIKALREAQQLTQVQLAEKVGQRYFTMVSQIETGAGRVPPEAYYKWAEALRVPVDEFVKKLLSYYDPYTYSAIFQPPIKKRKTDTQQLELLVDGKTLNELALEEKLGETGRG